MDYPCSIELLREKLKDKKLFHNYMENLFLLQGNIINLLTDANIIEHIDKNF